MTGTPVTKQELLIARKWQELLHLLLCKYKKLLTYVYYIMEVQEG